MGGEGSGRKTDPIKLIAQPQPQVPIMPEIFIPNYSGLQAVKKTDPLITASGHTVQDEGSSLTQRTKLNFSGSAVSAVDDSANDATVVNITGGGTETDPIFMDLSGSIATYMLSASTPLFALSGGAIVSLGTHVGDSSDPHGVNL